MKTILVKEFQILVDDEDFNLVNSYKWNIKAHGKTFRARRSNCWTRDGNWSSRRTFLSRFILKAKEGEIVDHIDGNGLNNQRSNLRICTHAQNMANSRKRKNTSSRFKGVFWNKNLNKWYSGICINKKKLHIGVHDSEIEAALSYNCSASFAFGKFARLNKV